MTNESEGITAEGGIEFFYVRYSAKLTQRTGVSKEPLIVPFLCRYCSNLS